MTTAQDPGTTLDKGDPGDDVQLRFRYQHSFAAIQCLRLLTPDARLSAVYCENHEDVLLRKRDGRYEGVQVKTRKFDAEPFRANDEAVQKSIARFAALEKSFRGWFDSFHFVTNHGFWENERDERCLPYLRDEIKRRGSLKRLPKTNMLRTFVEAICKAYGCEEADVAAALMKLLLFAAKSNLEHTYRDLVDAIARTRDYRYRPMHTIWRIADNLIFMVYEASSKKPGGTTMDVYALVTDYEAQWDKLVLAGKTITAERVEAQIANSLADTAENLLVSSGCVPDTLLPPGYDVMTEKMSGGGLQLERVNQMKDYKASFERLYLMWGHKHGFPEANKRLAHIKTMVMDDCIEARFAAERPTGAYASDMYKDLRARLEVRTAGDSLPLFGCSKEHLLGAVGSLTEECKVWWSAPFDLKAKKAS